MSKGKSLTRVRLGDIMPAAGGQSLFAGSGRGGMPTTDTLLNLMSGMGTDKDKLTGTVFAYGDLNKSQLDNAYRGDWISRKVVDIPAFDAFREWRHWEADKTDITAIEEAEKALKLQRKAMLALQRGRLYGGGALIMGVDQGLSSDPLEVEKLGKDCLKFVHVVSRHELHAGPIIWDVMSPWFGEPSYYTKSGQGDVSQLRLHPSRVVRFLGAESTDPALSQGWGDSILQVCADAVMACGTVANSVAQMVAEAKIDIVKIPELSENMGSKAYEEKLKARFGVASTLKSVFNTLIIDKEEEWDRIQQSFAQLPEVLQMYLLIVCGAADIPATRFLGQSPAGLSATGDSDTRNYYDRVGTEQNVVITPGMERLDNVLVISALGTKPDGIWSDWNPLWQMDEAQKAEVAVKKSQVFKADVDAGLITPLVLQKARENQLIEDGTYPGLEGLIEEFGEDYVEPPPPTIIAANTNEPALGPDGKPLPVQPGSSAAPAKGQAANGNAQTTPPAGKKSAVAGSGAPVSDSPDQMAERIRKGRKGKGKRKESHSGERSAPHTDAQIDDAATPRTLYARRDVINAKEIKAWAKQAGFATSLIDMHVTIAYIKTPVDWLAAGNDQWAEDENGQITIKAGGPRVMEKFGKAIVMAFANTDLAYRHRRIHGATETEPSYSDYTPHITITYDGGALDILHMVAYQGEIVLGPEIFEEIKTGFNNEVDTIEDADLGDISRPGQWSNGHQSRSAPSGPARISKPGKWSNGHQGRGNPNHVPAGSRRGGQFTTSSAASEGGPPTPDLDRYMTAFHEVQGTQHELGRVLTPEEHKAIMRKHGFKDAED